MGIYRSDEFLAVLDKSLKSRSAMRQRMADKPLGPGQVYLTAKSLARAFNRSERTVQRLLRPHFSSGALPHFTGKSKQKFIHPDDWQLFLLTHPNVL